MKSILTHPRFEDMGKQIADKGEIKHIEKQFENFADRWPNQFVENVKGSVEHQDVTYIGDFSKPEDLFSNYSMIRGITDYYANKVRVILPFFPVGTMERIETKGQIATAKYFADIMSCIPAGRTGKPSIHIFDIHNLTERFFFDSSKVNVELHTAMSLIKEKISLDTVIVFPDEGARKRFENDFDDYRIVNCSKKRIAEKREITIEDNNLAGKDVMIIDDLIQSGGTIIQTAKLLRSLGANKVDAFATHGVFPGESQNKLCENLDTLYTTNSIPENRNRASEIVNMEVLNIQSLIEKIIFGE